VTDLSSHYLGFVLRTPLVASSSPLTGSLDGLRRLEDAGVAAVVLPSLFEEQLTAIRSRSTTRSRRAPCLREALDYLPDLERYEVGPDSYLERIAAAKRSLRIPVIASLNGNTLGGWVEHARLIEQAGADALELNLYQVAADPAHDAATVEARDIELVETVRAGIEIPLALKVSPFYTAFGHFARRAVLAGAQGLVLFNRFYQPDIDLDALESSRTCGCRAPRRRGSRCAGSRCCGGACRRRSRRPRASTPPRRS
jgi:dihydroorotate dehydrogenase (fumarate)